MDHSESIGEGNLESIIDAKLNEIHVLWIVQSMTTVATQKQRNMPVFKLRLPRQRMV